MELKIIGGLFRGTKITLPDSMAEFRPTKNRVREAVASALVQDTPEARVLELCAGSAILSLELISRGAVEATAVEKERSRGSTIMQALKNQDLRDKLTCISSDVASFLNTATKQFDIIFFDPPYYDDALADLIPQTLNLLHPQGVLVFESATDDTYIAAIFAKIEGVSVKERRYGKSYIRYIRKET